MRNKPAQGRFEAGDGGEDVTFADYRRIGDRLYIDHVETPPHRRGKGEAGALMSEIRDFARAESLTIVPICSYAAAWLRRRERH